MARNLPQLTLKATGKLNKHSLSRLKECLELQRNLYNSSLDWLAHRPSPDLRTLRDSLRKDLTPLRSENPDYRNILLNVSDGTLQRAIINHLRHAAPTEGAKPAGKPRRKSSERFRTLTILSPGNQVIFPTKNLGTPKLKIKGLPAIRIKSSQILPLDQQPSTVHISLKHGQIHLRLVYDQPQHPRLKPKDKVQTALGLDLGIALTVATSTGDTYLSPNEQYLTQQIRSAQQRLQKAIAAAIRLGHCGFKAVLDDQNKQVLSSRDKPRRELVWLKAPTNSYLKAQETLTGLYERRNTLRHDFRHRVTTEIIKLAQAQGRDLIAVEDLQISNMTGSAKGTSANPGRNVRAKSGLNRSILQQGWGEILAMLAYKARKAGIRFISVWPARSSQTCSICGTADPKSRRTQAHFACTACGHEENADINASRVIAQRGLAKLRQRALKFA